MKNISIFKGKKTKLKATWSDGYITTIIFDGDLYMLEGASHRFKTLSDLTDHYNGTIITIKELRK